MKFETVTAASNQTSDSQHPAASRLPEAINGSQSPSHSRSARPKKWGKGKVLLLFITVLVLGGIALLIREKLSPKKAEVRDLVLFKVKRDRLEMTIVERGALESKKNSDIYCRVKTVTKAPQIKTLVEDGTEVRQNRDPKEAKWIYWWNEKLGKYDRKDGGSSTGPVVVEVHNSETGQTMYSDLLLDLEDTALVDQLKSQKTTMDTADSAMFKAEGAVKDQENQNINDIQIAKSKLENARFALMKYTGMSRDEILARKTIDAMKTDMAKLSSDISRDPFLIAQEDLVKFKGGDYRALVEDSMGQIENAKSDLTQQEDREAWAFRMAKKGYQTPSQAQAETSRRESYQLTVNKVTSNLQNIVKVQKLKDLSGFITDLENAEQNLKYAEVHAEFMLAQNKKDAAIKSSIFDQEKSHYHEILEEIKKCKIYAPQDGMVVYYIPEQARGGGGSQQSIIAQGEPVREGQKLMQIPDLKQMLVNTKVHEALVSMVHSSQKAIVRVDSFGGYQLKGKVDSVATLAAQQDFFAADVKVYTTKVEIESDDMRGLLLKPGMSAEVTITVEDALEDALIVPIQAIVGGSEEGADRTLVVMTADGPQERKVVVGKYNEKFAEIKSGIEAGDEIVENPKAVLGDKIKTGERSVSIKNAGRGERKKGGGAPGEKSGGGKGKSQGQ